MQTTERLETLAAAVEKYGFGRGLTEFDPGPAARLLRDVAKTLTNGGKDDDD